MDRKSIVVLSICFLLFVLWAQLVPRLYPPAPVTRTNNVASATNAAPARPNPVAPLEASAPTNWVAPRADAPEELLVAIRAKLDRRRALQVFDTRSAHLQTVSMLANVIEARESYTRGHVERVQSYALELARALGWDQEALAVCEYGALLHDIGKVRVPRAILNKRGPLLYPEWALLRRHPETGARMLGNIAHLQAALPYILSHHERWDGAGYPARLAGKDIPREGRLLAIVDAYDSMTSDRPYRRALPTAKALDEISRLRGAQFDPEMAEVFIFLRQREQTDRN